MDLSSPYRPIAPTRDFRDLLEMSSLLEEPLDEDIQVADPKTLCPWCDKLLPAKPSKTLRCLMTKAKKSSYPNPRRSNSLGLKAPFHCYLDVCQRHEYEVQELPKASANGWPKTIQFKKIPGRLEAMRTHLNTYVQDKSQSVFWRLLSREIKERGTLATLSLANQFNTLSGQVHAG